MPPTEENTSNWRDFHTAIVVLIALACGAVTGLMVKPPKDLLAWLEQGPDPRGWSPLETRMSHCTGTYSPSVMLRSYATAQYIHRRRTGTFATSLWQLGPKADGAAGLMDAETVAAAGFGGTPCAGYLYYTPPIHAFSLNPEFEYCLIARPATYNSSGIFTYYMDQSGVIWRKDMEGAMVTEVPGDPEEYGWVQN